MPLSYATVAKRLEALERQHDGPPRGPGGPGGGSGPDGEADRLRKKFLSSFLHAIAHIRREEVDHHPHAYDVGRLREESAMTTAAYLAALQYLQHADQVEAERILYQLCSERDIDPSPLESLVQMAVLLAQRAS